MSAAVAISNTSRPPAGDSGWNRFSHDELVAIVQALTGRRLDARPVVDQLVDAIDGGALRVLGRRRAGVVRQSGSLSPAVPFGRNDRALALRRLRADVAHDEQQRALADRLIAGEPTPLRTGAAVATIQVAARLNGRALLELGRPVVQLNRDGRLGLDAEAWPDPVWTARRGVESALRAMVDDCAGRWIGRGPAWVAADGRYGHACPVGEYRWVELLASAHGGRPDIRLVDDRLGSGRLPWSEALDALAADVARVPADEPAAAGVRNGLPELLASRAGSGWCWWVQHPDGVAELPDGDERDPGGWEVSDVLAEMHASLPPVGWVLCGMHDDLADTYGEDWAVVAVHDAGGWSVLAGARARAFSRADAAIGRWLPAGDVGLVDTCHDELDRACRWAARDAAQLAGDAPADVVEWDRLAPTWWRRRADDDPGVAESLRADMPARRGRLQALPMCGPVAPASIGPHEFSMAWAQGQGLTVDGQTGKVRARRGTWQGRHRAVTLVAYARARRDVAAANGDPDNTSAIARCLGVHRSSVMRRRREWLKLEGEALAALDADVRSTGLEVVAGLDSGAIQTTASTRPFLYWTGGKGRLVGELLRELPTGRLDYCEAFLGGGALFLELAATGRIGHAVLNDADPDIAHLWQMVQRDPDGVHSAASAWPWTTTGYAAALAAIDELAGVDRAGAILRVNRQARNGLWRRKSDGRLNMPPGRRKGQVNLGVSVEHLREVAAHLEGVEIRCADAEDVIDSLGPGTVAYADPPYWRIRKVKSRRTATGLATSETSSFSYDGRGFQAGDAARTIAALRRLGLRGGLGVLSQASTQPVLQLVEAAGGQVRWVTVLRSVSSKPSGREVVPEIIARFSAETAH